MTPSVRVVPNRHGTLTVRFRWNGRPVWQGTGRPDTPADRRALEPLVRRIAEGLERGTFDARAYLAEFPHGNLAAALEADTPRSPAFRAYAAEWLERQRHEGMRRVTWQTYRGQLHSYVLEAELPDRRRFGDIELAELSRRRILQLRAVLLARVSVQTAKNVVQGALRRVVNAARDEELVTEDLFAAMPRWPRKIKAPPDPFTREERDRVIAAMPDRLRPFVFFLFFTGMRPSEAVALRWADVHLETGMCRVVRSRTAGEENAPKVANAARTVQLVPTVVARLRELRTLAPAADDYLFLEQGEPIDQARFATGPWAAAVQRAGVRPRKFYATRHTFISVAVSLGRNLKWLAGYCGTSVREIERSYSLFLPDVGGEQLAALELEASGGPIAEAGRVVRA